MVVLQCPTARLLGAELADLLAKRRHLGAEPLDLAHPDLHCETTGDRQVSIFEVLVSGFGGESGGQVGHAVVIEGGVHALESARAFIEQVLVETHQDPGAQDLYGRNPRVG